MNKEYEITLNKFYSDCHSYYDVSKDIALEDIRFKKFTDLLDEADIFKNPKHCRYEGFGIKEGKWSILGYSFTSEIISEESESDNEEDAGIQQEYEWNFTFFNGFFSDSLNITSAKKGDIQQSIKEIVRFIEATFSGKSRFILQDFHPIRELQEFLIDLDKKNLLSRIDICIISDQIIEQENLETSIFIKSLELECKIHYWGINKWSDLSRSKNKRLPINIDFLQKNFACYEVPFLEGKKNGDLKYYLAIFPGDLLSDLYDNFHTQLLDNNVRVFLSLKRKYNRGMSKTIGEQPDMFFSYNNGISATASSIKINNLTGKIEAINDFQIVNGGQTTATLYHTKKILKKSLSDVFLQVKITVLRKTDNYSGLISNISRYANSQTAVRQSDFWTNDQYLLDIERLSTRNSIQVNGIFIYYFFERMTGQFKETREKMRKGTTKDIEAWEKQYPKELSFNKIDVARWFNTFNLLPFISALSAEKQFEIFMESKNKSLLTISKYKTIIGFGQIFNRARKVCGTKAGKEFPSIIGDPSVGMATTIYAMSYFQYITKGLFNFHKIYDQQINVSELDDILKHIIKKCWEQIAKFGGTSAQEQTKKPECWNYVKEKVNLFPAIISDLDNYLISTEELIRRESNDITEEEFYFSHLNILLSNNGKVLSLMLDLANSNTDFYKYKTLMRNQFDRIINKTAVITLSKVKELIKFKNKLSGFDLDKMDRIPEFKTNIDFLGIYNQVFKNRFTSFDNMEKIVCDKSLDDFEKYYGLLDEIKELVAKFDLHPGLSISDLERIDQILKIFNIEHS